MSGFSNSPIGLSPSENYYAAGLYAPEVLPYMLKVRPWESNINTITTSLGGLIYLQQPIVEQWSIENNLAVGTVSGRASVNSTTLTIAVLPNADYGRLNQVLIDSNTNTKAIIVSKQTNQYVIQLFASGTGSTTFASADFANGNQYTFAELSPNYRDGGNPESQYYTPNMVQYAMQYFEEGTQLHLQDFTDKKWNILSQVSTENSKMFGYTQVNMMVDAFNSKLERAYCGFTPQKIDANIVAGKHAMAGLPAQIRDFGGYYNEVPVMTETMLQNAVTAMRDEAGKDISILAMCGSDFLGWFQNTISDKYLVPNGDRNLFGGASIEGLNVTTYSFLGAKFNLMNYNGFNNANWFPAYSTTNLAQVKSRMNCMLLNTSPVEVEGNGMQPFISRYAYGNGESVKDATLTIVPKGIDQYGNVLTTATDAAKSCGWHIDSRHTVLLNNARLHGFLGIQ